ncbi:hypothetical protein BGX38DRAFT_1226415 [Terfezia claveryi]|nr:hypothetical protein BGX38DRAFT_1226415 [Terfezia claveryi]
MSTVVPPSPICICTDCGNYPGKVHPRHPITRGPPIPKEYADHFSQIIVLYNRLHMSLEGTYQPSSSILFLLRGPKRKHYLGPEPYIQRNNRALNVLKRFMDLTLNELKHAEDSLPIPDAAGIDSTGLGGHILPPNLACDNKTNITLVAELMYDILRTEMGYYTRGMKIQFPPATVDMAASWNRCLDLLHIGEGVCSLLTRVEELWVWTTTVTKQPLYYDWWAKLTAKHTWRELVTGKEKEMEYGRFAVHWKALEYHSTADLQEEPHRMQQQLKQPKDKSLKEAEFSNLIDQVERWKDGARGAPPPSAQPQLRLEEWDNEVPLPVCMTATQCSEDDLEGRSRVGFFQDIMGFVLELVEVEDVGDGRWWDNAMASVWTTERKAALASKVRRDWFQM